MQASPDQILSLLSLVLALVMTLLALASYHSYETMRKRHAEGEAEMRLIQTSAQDFRRKTSEAFMDQKSLIVRIETLERSLAAANEQLDKNRIENDRLQGELKELRKEYENTKLNLTEAYKRLREKPL